MKTFKQYINENRKDNIFQLNKLISYEKRLDEIIEDNPFLGDVIDIIEDELHEDDAHGVANRWQDVDLEDIKMYVYNGIIKLAKSKGFNDIKNPDIFLNRDYNERFKKETDNNYDPTETEGYNTYWYARNIETLININGNDDEDI